jgi:hypothetical protein
MKRTMIKYTAFFLTVFMLAGTSFAGTLKELERRGVGPKTTTISSSLSR